MECKEYEACRTREKNRNTSRNDSECVSNRNIRVRKIERRYTR